MKRPLNFLLPLLLTLTSPALLAQWTPIPLPCRPNTTKVQTLQDKVFASTTDSRVYESTDLGKTWHFFLYDAPGFTINPANNNLYYFGDDFSPLKNAWLIVTAYQSPATAWYSNPLHSSVQPPGLTFSHDTIYVYRRDTMMRGKISGNSLAWTFIFLPGGFNASRCYVSGKHIWAGSAASVVHSSNGGLTWKTEASDPENRMGFAVSGDTVLLNYFNPAGGARVLKRSINQGKTWVTETGHPYLAYLESGTPFLGYDAAKKTAYRSWNGLTDWQPLTDLPALPAALASTNGALFAALPSGAWYQAGGPWRPGDFGVEVGDPTSGGILRKTSDFLLFGGENGGYGLAAQADGASGWEQSEKPYFAERIFEVGNFLVGSGAYGTYRAPKGGSKFEWTLLNTQGGYLTAMNGNLYLADPANGFIFRSTDGGQNWTQTGVAPSLDIPNAFAGAGGRFFQRVGSDLLVSEDEGQNWEVAYTFPFSFVDPQSRLLAANGRIFLSYSPSQQIFASTDNGSSFKALPAPKKAGTQTYHLRMHENILFLYNGDHQLYRSTDGGQTWKSTKLPYIGFNLDRTTNSLTAGDGQLFLFDPSGGRAWASDLDDLPEASPCDSISVSMPPEACGIYANVNAPNGMQYSWYEDGVLIQQTPYWYNDFFGKGGKTYRLVVTHPSGCSVSAETKNLRPTAEAAYDPVLPCDEKLATVDFSGSSQNPGVRHLLSAFGSWIDYYTNEFDAAGNPANPLTAMVPPGDYLLRVIDTVGGEACETWDTLYIKREIEQTIGELNINPAGCAQSNGSASVTFTTDPFETLIGWSTGASGPSVAGLAPGWYSVTVSEGFCAESRNFQIEENLACKVRIRGTIWNDPAVPDCQPDANTYPAKEVLLRLLPDSLYTFTDEQGSYEFVRSPGNYSVEFIDPVRFDLLCPQSGKIAVSLPNFGGVSAGNDFFVVAKPVKNLAVTFTSGPAVPGFPQSLHFKICNHGAQPVSDGVLEFHYAPELSGITPNYAFSWDDPPTHTATLSPVWLNPQECQERSFSMQVSADAPLGTPLHFSADFLPVSGDFTPADNHQEWTQHVVGSFDPNDKRVSPGDTEYGGKIFEKDSVLRYTIRFQNTGKYPATTVEIRDTLDAHLDVTSILPGGSSHPYNLKLRFEGKNVLVFRFENIYLPDSAVSQYASQGFVSFSIKRKPGLPVSTRIRNRAGIYFDFNKPVVTNRVESVLSPPLGTANVFSKFGIRLFPNPNPGRFTVELPVPAPATMFLKISDLAGRTVFEKQADVGSQGQTLRVESLPPGLYFLQVVSEGKVPATEKFVKE